MCLCIVEVLGMKNGIYDILAPYEDEVLVSWIVRMLRMYTVGKVDSYIGGVMRDLFGPTTSERPGLYLQKGLQYFCDNCGISNRSIFDSEETMYEVMSVVPFYLYFCSDDYKKLIKESISNTSYYIYTEAKLGIRFNSKYIEGQGYYKFCPECLKHQEEYYLKKEHQIQGNLVCWEHGCSLYRVPYSLRWKDIDFIDKIEKDIDISEFVLSDEERETAQRIALLIHNIFKDGFLDDIEELRVKIIQKLIEDGILSEEGVFYKWENFMKTLGASYLYSASDLKRDIAIAIDANRKMHVNPIIYLFLIHHLFGGLKEYYDYEINESTNLPFQKVKFPAENKVEVKHDIEYYVQNMKEAFFEEYSILGDTEKAIIEKHELCGTIFSVDKKGSRLKKCPCCRGDKTHVEDVRSHYIEKIRYCRYVNTEEYAELHGKEMKQIRNYCNQNRIPGAIRVGVNILIPIDAPYPRDMRVRNNKELR